MLKFLYINQFLEASKTGMYCYCNTFSVNGCDSHGNGFSDDGCYRHEFLKFRNTNCIS